MDFCLHCECLCDYNQPLWEGHGCILLLTHQVPQCGTACGTADPCKSHADHWDQRRGELAHPMYAADSSLRSRNTTMKRNGTGSSLAWVSLQKVLQKPFKRQATGICEEGVTRTPGFHFPPMADLQVLMEK